MDIQWSRYQLKPRSSLNSVTGLGPREGSLLRVRDSSGPFGYADLHPWPELGDPSLDEQLAQFKKGQISTQIEQTIAMALHDANYRQHKKSLLDLDKPLKNNFLVSDLSQINEALFAKLRGEDFSIIKLKVGRNEALDLESVRQTVAAGFRVRLDFNSSSNPIAFEQFISKLPPEVLAQIDYVEDPFVYDEKEWARFAGLVPLAMDNELSRLSWDHMDSRAFHVLIIKPAKINPLRAVELCKKWNLKFTVTSYMDHPVGCVHAYAWAMRLYEDYKAMSLDPGCLTINHYEASPFSEAIKISGPYLLKNSGYGCGFDHLLEGLQWTT